MKNLIEIWAIDKNWNTTAEFKNEDEINIWLLTNPMYFQILYRINGSSVHVYKQYSHVAESCPDY
jgi:hypothetical protein